MRSVRTWLVAALGVGITVTALVAPSSRHHADQWTSTATILETSIALVGTLVALLTFGRFRRSGSSADLLIAAGVGLLAWVYTLFGVVPDLISPYSVGNGVSERVELWGMIVVRSLAAGLFLAAATIGTPEAPSTAPRPPARHYVRVAVAVTASSVGALALLVWLAPIGGSGLVQQVSWPLSLAPVLELVDGALFFAAFLWLSGRAAARSDPLLAWIATGSVFAGFSMINYALLPVGGPAWLHSGDLLRAAAVCTWGIGAVTEILSYWSRLADAVRSETRRSVALDLHDGLAQELALLRTFTYEPPDVRAGTEWHEQLQATATRALAEARRAIAALADNGPVPFEADIERVVEAVARPNVEIRVDIGAGMDAAALDSLQRESIVRIVREAVTNAVRHGGASHIDIVFEDGQTPTLRVLDDGVGFDPADTASSGRFGMVSMRERAESIGASLAVRSRPGEGTTVELLWP